LILQYYNILAGLFNIHEQLFIFHLAAMVVLLGVFTGRQGVFNLSPFDGDILLDAMVYILGPPDKLIL
jgi:hypothetical protein